MAAIILSDPQQYYYSSSVSYNYPGTQLNYEDGNYTSSNFPKFQAGRSSVAPKARWIRQTLTTDVNITKLTVLFEAPSKAIASSYFSNVTFCMGISATHCAPNSCTWQTSQTYKGTRGYGEFNTLVEQVTGSTTCVLTFDNINLKADMSYYLYIWLVYNDGNYGCFRTTTTTAVPSTIDIENSEYSNNSIVYIKNHQNKFEPYSIHLYSNGNWNQYDAYIYINNEWVKCGGTAEGSLLPGDPDVSISPDSLTQYHYLTLSNPGLIEGTDYYLGYILDQNYYWLQLAITPTVNTTSLRLTLNYPTLIAGSVTNSNFPWRLLVANTNAPPISNNIYTSIIYQAPTRHQDLIWDAYHLQLEAGKTYYLSVWAGSPSLPGGVISGSNTTPTCSIILNPSS